MSDKYASDSYMVRGLKDLLAGTLAGCGQILSGHPLDTIKVRLQVQRLRTPNGETRSLLYKGPIDCLVKSVKAEGFASLYRGMASPLVMMGAITAVEMGSWGLFKKLLHSAHGLRDDERLGLGDVCLAGLGTGLVTPFVYTPTELVKSRLQAQRAGKLYTGPIDCAMKTIRATGFLGLWKGTLPTMAREAPANVAYFGGYELAKTVMHPSGTEMPLWKAALCGSFAGVANWTVCMPQDVIKTRIQVAHDTMSVAQAVRDLYADEGVTGFYRGFGAVIPRAVIVSAVTFFTYELVLEALA